MRFADSKTTVLFELTAEGQVAGVDFLGRIVLVAAAMAFVDSPEWVRVKMAAAAAEVAKTVCSVVASCSRLPSTGRSRGEIAAVAEAADKACFLMAEHSVAAAGLKLAPRNPVFAVAVVVFEDYQTDYHSVLAEQTAVMAKATDCLLRPPLHRMRCRRKDSPSSLWEEAAVAYTAVGAVVAPEVCCQDAPVSQAVTRAAAGLKWEVHSSAAEVDGRVPEPCCSLVCRHKGRLDLDIDSSSSVESFPVSIFGSNECNGRRVRIAGVYCSDA